jgi:hypothetical protein
LITPKKGYALVTSAPRLQVIEGGRPPDHEWTEADIRRMLQPSIKALPFVKTKPDAQPTWHPESYWDVRQSRSWDESQKRGRQYAVSAVAAMRADGINVLSSIFRDMIHGTAKQIATAQKEKRREPKRDAVMGGFLSQLAAMYEPRDGGEFGAEIDRALSLGRDALRELCLDRRQNEPLRMALGCLVSQLEKIRDRIHGSDQGT